ncbi:MAG: 30S ribosomal protein S4 [Patescibacteria group bacterium]
MARITSAKCKLCRREGEKLFLRGERCFGAKCAIVKRNFIPGVHGPTARRQKLTGYGIQLREKQKAKKIYGLLERQFANSVAKATKMKGDSGANLFTLLETRLDNVIYRLGIGRSRAEARQRVSHGHIEVNGKKVDIPSSSVKVGDLVSIKEGALKSKFYENIFEKISKLELPEWMIFDPKTNKAKIISLPDISKSKQEFDPKIIIEFYSR